MDWKVLLLLLQAVWAVVEGQGNVSAEVFPTEPDAIDLCPVFLNMTGQWATTLWGDVTIDNLTLDTGSSLGEQEITQLRCKMSLETGDLILMSEQSFNLFSIDFWLMTCIQVIPRNKDNFHVIIKMAREKNLNNEPIQLVPANLNVDPSQLCEQDPKKWVHGDMIRKSQLSSATMPCPDELTGNARVNFISDLQRHECPNGANMTSCDLPEGSVFFNYSRCDSSVFFQDNDTILCLGHREGATLLYHSLGEANNTFSCATVAQEASDDTISVLKMYSGGCDGSWYHELALTGPNVEALIHSQGECPVDQPEMPVSDVWSPNPMNTTTNSTVGVEEIPALNGAANSTEFLRFNKSIQDTGISNFSVLNYSTVIPLLSTDIFGIDTPTSNRTDTPIIDSTESSRNDTESGLSHFRELIWRLVRLLEGASQCVQDEEAVNSTSETNCLKGAAGTVVPSGAVISFTCAMIAIFLGYQL